MAEERQIAPSQFHGTAAEDAELWARHFETYCLYKGYDGDRKIKLFKVLLQGGAAQWLDGLEVNADTPWDTYKDLFLKRYLTPEYMHFKSARSIMNTKMEPGEKVDDYVSKMQHLAKSIKADEKMIRFAIMNGFSSANYVAQKQPKTMVELLDAARIAEMTQPPPITETSSEVTERLSGMEQMLKQLTTKVEAATVLNVNAVQSRPNTPPAPRPQSPKKVHFQES